MNSLKLSMWLVAVAVLATPVTFSSSFISFSPHGHHHHATAQKSPATCIQQCTLADRPQTPGKLQSILKQKRRPFNPGALLATASFAILSYYHSHVKDIFKLVSWRPPDRVLLSGLHHASL
jgi:hypothetical protein